MLTQQSLDQRTIEEANYIVEHSTTIRITAKKFGVSKTTVHKDLTERLKKVDSKLYKKVRKVLDINIEQRAIRGGEAIRRKYKNNPRSSG